MKAFAVMVMALAVLPGCSPGNKAGGENSGTAKPAPAAKAEEALRGRAAFQKTYIAARGWASDAQPFLEESQPTSTVTGKDGTSAVWLARFGSVNRGTAKGFTWSGSDAEDAPSRGVNPSSEDMFSPSNASTHPFDLGFLKVDSDQAFSVAQDHGGKKLLAKAPALPIFYRLHWEPHANALVWHVMYGGSGSRSKLSVAVNATSGAFINVER